MGEKHSGVERGKRTGLSRRMEGGCRWWICASRSVARSAPTNCGKKWSVIII
jgi:hypothetical protein